METESKKNENLARKKKERRIWRKDKNEKNTILIPMQIFKVIKNVKVKLNYKLSQEI